MSEEFHKALKQLLDEHPQVCTTNTPTHILAKVMYDSLRSFETALLLRSNWFRKPTGIEAYPYDNQSESNSPPR